MFDVQFRVLGIFEVLIRGQPVVLGSAKQRALLTFLLIHANEVQPTDRIMDALWSEEPPAGGVKTLRYHVSKLRSTLGGDSNVVVSRGGGYVLDVPPEAIDSRRFERLLAEAEGTLAEDPERASQLCGSALDLWHGTAFADFSYAEFVQAETRRLDELRLAAIELRIDADLAAGHDSRLVPELESLVAEYPLREQFWHQLMTALYRAGRQPDALRTYQRARDAFGEMGIEPSAELAQLEQQILLRDLALELRRDPPRGTRSGAVPSKLPAYRTAFVGRERELELGSRLLGKSRLLTIIGPPGAGKTRMACRLAANHLDEYPNGAFFVPLAAVTDERLVDAAISQALGLREMPGQSPLESLRIFLQDRRTLLILDNFEQVIGAAPLVGDLLDSSLELRILITSRSSLGLSGEQEFPIPPLDVPPHDEPLDLETLSAYDAIALFVERAQAADPRFNLNDANAASIAEITHRLDGLPLAIELAAARVKLLTPKDLLNRLQRSMAVLTGGPRDTVDHHRTLRDAIAWSHELLEPGEKVLFRRLGVFRGFTLEAATAVADLAEDEVFAGIDSLLSKSLVYRMQGGGIARFGMLETLREFAREESRIAGELEDLARRHAHYFRDLAESCGPRLTSDAQSQAMELLTQELDNTRGALRYALDAPDPDLGLCLAGFTWRFWESTGQIVEGKQWFESLLRYHAGSGSARAKGLTGFAGLAYWQAEFDEAAGAYQEALQLYREMGDRFNEADTLSSLSLTASWAGDPDSGKRFATEALAIFERLGAQDQIGMALMAKGFALQLEGDFAASRPLWESALAIAREAGDSQLATSQVISSAIFEYHKGNLGRALRIAVVALEEAVAAKNVPLAGWMLEFVAAFAATASPEAAVRLAGAAYSSRQRAGGGMPIGRLDIRDARTVAASSLSPESLEDLWAEGLEMSLDQAFDSVARLDAGGANSGSETGKAQARRIGEV